MYGLDLGIAGSAWGTVVAQYGAALAYVVIVAARGPARGRVGATAAGGHPRQRDASAAVWWSAPPR